MRALTLTAIIASALLVGCSSGGYNVRCESERVTVRPLGDKAMGEAIIAGAQSREWVVTKQQPGCISLELDVRSGKHTVQIDVEYGSDWFSVKYVGSTNMDYNPSTGAIRGKYVQWVRNLKKDIRLQAMKVK